MSVWPDSFYSIFVVFVTGGILAYQAILLMEDALLQSGNLPDDVGWQWPDRVHAVGEAVNSRQAMADPLRGLLTRGHRIQLAGVLLAAIGAIPVGLAADAVASQFLRAVGLRAVPLGSTILIAVICVAVILASRRWITGASTFSVR